ncbi:MAG: DNA starvation/stationary phase protection protein [Bacteroidetes bacterium]|nr:DNA starvation/stationary phase protection protein [Bacteroidota bacterium]
MTPTIKNSLVSALNEFLADQHVVYIRARNYHWNVTGKHFFGLHAAFEKLYDELAEHIDEVAERIRVLGELAPGTMKEFLELASLKEHPGSTPDCGTMVKNLADDLRDLSEKALSIAKKASSEFNDEVTANILYDLAQSYQKFEWMYRSTLVNE